MAAEVILRVKVDRSQYNAFKAEVKKGIDTKGTDGVSKSLKDTGEAAQQATTKIQSLGEMLTKKIAWYSISMAITSVTRAFKDALTEIKNVDTQLTNIMKVSNKTAEDLQGLADKAYSTASKYGVQASKYMEAVYEYTKAGFQDNADAMAELSTKAMLVGDTTAAVADKFLISANAAWEYGKNVEALSLLVDRADYINNNYATTFDKIADGFPRVASVAHMAGMSAEETMAALGTITATTQETASRAGTALRALILNILGDTSTEIEDGVTNTQEEIDSLRKVLEIYAKDVVDAADASGTLINPMEALAALSKAYKDNALTERDLFLIEKGLGGKLRTNQLDALLKNFDMYQEMINGMATAAGTADKEITTMLGSWEAKSNILKNTWTEFISKGLNANTFKGVIDWLTKMLDRFDGLNEILPIIAGAMVALFAPAIVANISKMVSNVKNLALSMQAMFAGVKAEKISISGAIGTAVSAIATVVTIAYTAYKNHIMKIRQEAEDATNEALDNAQRAQQTTENLSELYGAYKAAEAANDGSTAAKQALTTATENLAAALGIEKDAIDGVTKSWDELTAEELERQRRTVEAAVDTAGMNLLIQAGTFHSTSNRIIAAGQERQEKYYQFEDPSGLGGVEYEYLNSDERLRRIVIAYKQAQEQLAGLSKAYLAQSYSDINDAYMSGELSSGAKVIAGDAYFNSSKKEIEKQINKLRSNIDEASFVQAYIEAVEAREKFNKAVEEFGENSTEAAAAADTLAEKEAELADEAEIAAQKQKDLADAFSEVMGNANSATEALEKYKKAVEADNTKENADAYAEAGKAAMEAIKAGYADSAEISAFGDLFFSPEKLVEMHKAGKTIAEELASNDLYKSLVEPMMVFDEKTEEWVETYKTGEEVTKTLTDWLKAFDTDSDGYITEVEGDLSHIGAQLLETENGTKIIVDDWELLSQQTGLSVDYLKAHIALYNQMIPGLEASVADLTAFAEKAEAIHTTFDGIKQIDITKVMSEAFAQGATTDQVLALVDALQQAQENGEFKLIIGDEDVENADEQTKNLIDSLGLVDDPHYVRVNSYGAEEARQKVIALNQALDKIQGRAVSAFINVSSTVSGLAAKFGFAEGTDNAPGGTTLVNEEGPELIQEGGRARIAGGGLPTITNLKKGAKVWTAKETKAILGNSNLTDLYNGIHAYASGTPSTIANVARTTWGEYSRWNADVSENQHLKYLQSIVSLRKAELDLIENSGGSVSWQVEKMGTIQTALLNEIKHLQAIGGSQEDIVKLTSEWYEIQNKIAEMTAPKIIAASELYKNLQSSINKQIDSLQDKRDAELKTIDKQIEALQKAHDTQAKTNELKEKELEVTKAQQELDNAKAQRTVRVWNATKKQWEWTYNATDVRSATENLTSAKQALTDYKNEQAYQNKIAALETQQASITQKYNTQIEKWQKVLDSIEEPVKSISASMKELLKYTTSDMTPTVNRIKQAFAKNGLTFDSGGVLRGLGGIKATSADEVILPPDVTKKMLNPVSSKLFSQRLDELRYIYGATGSLAGYTNNAIGSQHNGDIYTFGNVTLSTEQAKNTTVYDLVRMARGLRSYASAI